MPGQYYDEETGKHYNYFRDYDPETGRYIESDPIGLSGGMNTYAYVGNSPIVDYDRFGLMGAVGAGAGVMPPPGGTNTGIGGYDWSAPWISDSEKESLKQFRDWILCGKYHACIDSDFPDKAANDDTYKNEGDNCPQKVGDTAPPPPNNCADWKATVLAKKNNAEMLFMITEEPRFIANVNYEIAAYNASCQNITGKVDPLIVDLNKY